jgi:hypothetical protein
MTIELVFSPPPSCARPACCDLSCVWPAPTEPLVWEGDGA